MKTNFSGRDSHTFMLSVCEKVVLDCIRCCIQVEENRGQWMGEFHVKIDSNTPNFTKAT